MQGKTNKQPTTSNKNRKGFLKQNTNKQVAPREKRDTILVMTACKDAEVARCSMPSPCTVCVHAQRWGACTQGVLCSFPSWKKSKRSLPSALEESVWSPDENLISSAFSQKEAQSNRRWWRACQYTYRRLCWVENLFCIVSDMFG